LRLRAIGEPSERAAFAAELWLRGIRVDKVTLDEAVHLRGQTRQVMHRRDEFQAATDLVAAEATNPCATYSILLKRYRQLCVLNDYTGAHELMCRMRHQYPDAATQGYDRVCEYEHREVLRWLKT